MAESVPDEDRSMAVLRRLLLSRMAVAAIQGAALYALTNAATQPLSWPATSPEVFEPLLLAFSTVPIVIMLGLGQIRAKPLAIWAVIVTVLIIGLGWHDAARGRVEPFSNGVALWPWFELCFALAAALFVAHVLAVDTIAERRLVPPYPRHFDTAWKQGLQAVLSVVFVGLFWGVLELGASLFHLLNIDFFQRLIARAWFAWPATTLSLAVAIHVTDVQSALTRGARTLALTLFSWLLPLLAIILLGFLISLGVTSLTPLWKTHFATSLLLWSAALTVFLINTCYQDGGGVQAMSRVKRIAGSVAAIELVPLVVLAAWALSLRVEQYGWSVNRIMAGAATLILAGYAIGYASAVAWVPTWLKRVEVTNFVTAYVALAVFLALFSPLADPARLMVADQVGRLKSGALKPDGFDFMALKFDGARWGQRALTELSRDQAGPDAAAIRTGAARALAAQSPTYYAEGPATHLSNRIEVYPAGRRLPAALSDPGSVLWSGLTPTCLLAGTDKCQARFLTLRPGGLEAVVVVDQNSGYVFQQDSKGAWARTARIEGQVSCEAVRKGFAGGDVRLDAHSWPDLMVAGRRLALVPNQSGCDADPSPISMR